MIATPQLVAELPLLPEWQQGVVELLKAATDWFECEQYGERIDVLIRENGKRIEIQRRLNEKASVAMTEDEGPFGALLVMALAHHCRTAVFDSENNVVPLKPLNLSLPYLAGVEEKRIKLCAAALGLLPKPLVPKSAKPSLLIN